MTLLAPLQVNVPQAQRGNSLAERLALAQVAQTPIQPLQLQEPRTGVELAGNLAQTLARSVAQRRKVEAEEEQKEGQKAQLVRFLADRQGGDISTIQSLNQLPLETLSNLASSVAQQEHLPDQPESTSLLTELAAANIDPASPEGQRVILGGRNRQTINVDARGAAQPQRDPNSEINTRFGEKLADEGAKRFSTIMADGDGAVERQVDVEVLKEAQQRLGEFQSQAPETQVAASRLFGNEFMSRFGLAVDAPAAEVFMAASTDLALENTQKLAGAISEREIDEILKTVPNLRQTPEARTALIEFAEASNELLLERQQVASAFGTKFVISDPENPDEDLNLNQAITRVNRRFGPRMRSLVKKLLRQGAEPAATGAASGRLRFNARGERIEE